MLQKTRGIVLNSIKYSETSIITKIYTEEFGLLSFLVRGVRKRKARIPASFFQAFTLLQLDINYKSKSNLQNIREVNLEERTDELHSDVFKTTIAIFLSELIYKSLEEDQQDKALFEFIHLSISFLNTTESSSTNFHLIFLLQLSKYLGFYPSSTFSADQKYFNMESGLFEVSPYHDLFLNEELSGLLKQLMNQSYITGNQLKLTGKQRRYLLDELIRFYQLHLPGLGNISSKKVLESVFD